MRQLCFLALCLAACGDDGVRHTPDAAPHDGAPDSPIDAALQPVTLTAMLGGAPQAGVYVYFLNADSSVVLATRTDATGVASATMAAGGSVTAIDPYGTSGSNRELYSFLSVKPGDHLVLDGAAGVAPQITVTVTAPIDNTPGVLSYEVQSPCGRINLQSPGSGAAPTAQLTLNACGPKTDFVILTRDDAYQIVNYIYAHDVAVTDQGTVDLSTATYAAGATRTYQATNIPAGFTATSFLDALIGKPNVYVDQSNVFPADGSPAPITTVGFGTHMSQISVQGAHVGQHYFLDWAPTPPPTRPMSARACCRTSPASRRSISRRSRSGSRKIQAGPRRMRCTPPCRSAGRRSMRPGGGTSPHRTASRRRCRRSRPTRSTRTSSRTTSPAWTRSSS